MRTLVYLCYRFGELLFAAVMFVLTLPVVLLAALAIRIETPGNPFFFQTRLGWKGKPFRIFKLRGMYIDARARFPHLYDYSQYKHLDFYFHHQVDPRLTRVGSFIRSLSIDELPNFWNVLTGDMRLVGPRPEIPEVLDLYGQYRDEYLSVRPGITCLSKISGRDRLTKRETIELDIDYVRQASITLDLKILWRTFLSVVVRKDVFHHAHAEAVRPEARSALVPVPAEQRTMIPEDPVRRINEIDTPPVQR